MRRLTWCGLSGTTRSTASGAAAVRSWSTARAKAPTSRRRSSRRPATLAFEVRTRTRSCPAARRRLDVVPDQAGDLGPAQPGAERQGDDRGITPSAGRGCGGRLLSPSAALGPAGRLQQLERGGVVQSDGLARRSLGRGRVLARDAAQRVGDQRRLRRVRQRGGAVCGRDRRRRGLHGRELPGLGPLGEIGGYLRRGWCERVDAAPLAPAPEPVPLRRVRHPGVVGQRGGRRRGDAGPGDVVERGQRGVRVRPAGRRRGLQAFHKNNYRISMIHWGQSETLGVGPLL